MIHTPQQVKVIHKYHTTEHYAKGYGYGYSYNHKPRKSHRGKKARKRGRGRGRYRKRYLRKVGHRVPYTGGKSYGMYNYAKNYRNWTPQRRPLKRYRDSYLPIQQSQAQDGDHADSYLSIGDTQEHDWNHADSYLPIGDSQEHDGHHAYSDYRDYDDSLTESRPFGNEIQAIDYYANRNRNPDRYNRRKSNLRNRDTQQDYVSRDSYQPDNAAVESRDKAYSTLPDEIINTHSSSGDHDFQYASAADQDFQVFQNHNAGHGQDFGFNNQNFGNGHEFRSKNQNQNSGNRQELRFNVNNFPALQGTQFSGHNLGNGQRTAGRDDVRYNTQTAGGANEVQYNTQSSQTGQESRSRNHHFGGFSTQNSAGRYNSQNSANGAHSREPVSHGSSNNNRPHRETEHNFGEVANLRPTSEDLYYKAFRSFSFRKNPSHSSNKGQLDSFSGASFNSKLVPHSSPPPYQSGIAHSDRDNNQWFNGRTGPNKDHDIGFFEGLEDINDGVGI